MMSDKIKLIAGIIGLGLIAASTLYFTAYIEGKVMERRAMQSFNWSIIEKSLERSCHAKWPLRGTNYDGCIKNIQRMRREDI